jgi:hypothetical protein
MSVSRIPVPSAPGRKGRTEEMRRSFEEQIKTKEAAAARRRELHDTLVRFVNANRGWVVSAVPGRPIRIETPPDSDLIDKLAERGFDLRPTGTGTRIEGGFITPICIYTLRLPSLGK